LKSSNGSLFRKGVLEELALPAEMRYHTQNDKVSGSRIELTSIAKKVLLKNSNRNLDK
jgi:hypothetical protein